MCRIILKPPIAYPINHFEGLTGCYKRTILLNNRLRRVSHGNLRFTRISATCTRDMLSQKALRTVGRYLPPVRTQGDRCISARGDERGYPAQLACPSFFAPDGQRKAR